MSRPLTVTIPHSLGRAAARKRIEDGIAQLRDNYAGQFTALEETWNGDRFECRLSVFKQTISGSVDVGDDTVTVSILLPIGRFAGLLWLIVVGFLMPRDRRDVTRAPHPAGRVAPRS